MAFTLQKTHHPRLKAGVILLLFLLITWTTFVTAGKLGESEAVQSALSAYGYLTVLGIALVAGLNAIVPIPAATFVPLFTEAGLYLPLIITMLIVGTTAADFIGYALGRLSRDYVRNKYPRMLRWLKKIHDQHAHLILPFIIAYAAIIPLPNEIILIPLAIIGYKTRLLLVALLVGNTVNQTALAYGYENVFRAFF